MMNANRWPRVRLLACCAGGGAVLLAERERDPRVRRAEGVLRGAWANAESGLIGNTDLFAPAKHLAD